jgi:hypothetical protein
VISKLGAFTISLLQELSSLVWMGRETMSEIAERIAKHRAPFCLEHFFYQSNRVGVGSVPMIILLSVFIGLTMALLTGYQLQRFGIVTLVPAVVSVSFTHEMADNMKHLTGPGSDLALTIKNAKTFMETLNNSQIPQVIKNTEQFTDILKQEPWRLLWPATKSYPGDEKEPSAKKK